MVDTNKNIKTRFDDNSEFSHWFSTDQFFAEIVGTFVVVFGSLIATAFAINKLKNTPFTFGIAISLVIFLAPLFAIVVLLFFNNFEIITWPIITPVNIIANIIYYVQVENDYNVFKSIPYVISSQILGTVFGVLLYIWIIRKFPTIKPYKNPLKKDNVRSSIFREISYIGIFSAFLAFNKTIMFEKNSLNFFAYNSLNALLAFIFLVSAYKHGYFTTNFYALIGYNMLLKIKRLNNSYTIKHCLTVISSYTIFAMTWTFVMVEMM